MAENDLQAFERMVERILREIPTEFSRYIKPLAIQVCDVPDDRLCREMQLDDPMELLGLYQGVDLEQKSIEDVPEDLDRVYLYRLPLLEYWREEGGLLEDHVRETLLHEIGHHFGFSDADMERICAEARSEHARKP